ncbi:MAG: hypothetical protein ABEN55_07250 [Bradymonadaceae bacterium]
MMTASTNLARMAVRGTSLGLIATVLACLIGCGSIDETADTSTASNRLSSLETPCGPNPSLTGRALLDRLANSYTAPLTTDDGDTPSTVRLEIAYHGGARRCIGRDRTDGAARLELGVTLELRSEDGTVDAAIPGTLSVLAGSDQVRFSGAAPVADEAVEVSTADTGARSATQDAPTRVLVEGWIATDRQTSQGAVRLLRERGPDLWNHQTVASWGVP